MSDKVVQLEDARKIRARKDRRKRFLALLDGLTDRQREELYIKLKLMALGIKFRE